MKKLNFIFILLILSLLFSCKEHKILSPEQRITQVEINVQGLHNLGPGFWYEAWLIYDEGKSSVKKSVGIFTVDDNGTMSKSAFNVNLGYLQLAKGCIITIENDDVPGMRFNTRQITQDSSVVDTIFAPSGYQILAATVNANDGTLSVGDAFLLNTDFSAAAGTYILATPTDSNNTDPTRGIWFVNKDTTGAVIQGLNLPDLPANWNYEGWVNYNGTVFSTGKFTKPAAADKSSKYGDSTGEAFPFPGEDFIIPDTVTTQLPANLLGLEVGVNLIPPYPPGAEAPYTVTLFSATVPATAKANVVYDLNNVAQLPEGQLKFNIEIYE